MFPNEAGNYGLLIMLVLLVLFCCVHTGCKSSGAVIGQPIVDYSNEVARLEKENEQLRERISRYDSAVKSSVERLEHIRTGAAGISGDVDEIIQLFDQYRSAVDECIGGLRAVQGEAGRANEAGDGAHSTDSATDSGDDSGVHPSGEGN